MEQISINQIIQEEISEYNQIKKSSSEKIGEIIQRSAYKLEKAEVCEKNEISRILKRHFTEHKRYVDKVLPDKFKLVTKPKDDKEPKSKTQEYFYQTALYYAEKAKLSAKIFDLLKKNPEFEDSLTNKIDDKIFDLLQDQIAELEVLKSQIDKREFLHDWDKIMVRKLALEDTLHHVAQRFDQSAKWIKHINEDKDLTNILEEIKKCPNCDWNIAHWFNVQSERVRKGLPVQKPKGHGI